MKYLALSLVLGFAACTTKAPSTVSPVRAIAEVLVTDKDLSEKKLNKLLSDIFQAYMLGQALLYEFDDRLNRAPEKILRSDVYNQLLAIRTLVDEHEENFSELYLKMVRVAALNNYTPEQKNSANQNLKVIGNFMEGILTDRGELPSELKPIVLHSLREKQTELYDELNELYKSLPAERKEERDIIWKNMALLRHTRMSYHQDLKKLEGEPEAVKKAVKALVAQKDFKQFKKDIKKMSKTIKKLTDEIGRGTSSDAIFASAGVNGNVSGRGFPANTWSITYDDGPGGKTTPIILQNLKARNMKATFFMLGKQVEALPTISNTIKTDGHDLASHSYDHAQLTKLSGEALDKQISGSKSVIEKKLGLLPEAPIKLFRLPYGAGVNVTSVRQKIADAKMIHVFWNVDTLDWQDKNPQSILDRTLKQMKTFPKNSGVVLFHDIHSQSVTASTLLMDHFIKNNITVCTVQEVIDQLNQGLATCKK